MNKQNKTLIFLASFLIIGIAIGGYFLSTGVNKKKQDIKQEKVSLKDDFYEAINYELLASREIPKDQPDWNLSSDINNDILEEEKEILKEMIKDPNSNHNMYVYYQNMMNKEMRTNLGFEPIKNYMDKIDAAQTMQEFLNTAYEIDNEIGTNIVLDKDLSKDIVDKSQIVLTLQSAESDCAILLEKNYNQVIEIEKKMYVDFLVEYGYEEKEAQLKIDNYFNFIKSSCNGSLSVVDLRDPDKTYNLYSLDEVKNIYSNIDIEKYLKDYHLNEITSFVIISETTAKEYNKLFTEDNLNNFKIDAELSILLHFYNALTPELEQIFIKSNNVSTGIQEEQDYEDLVLERLNKKFSDCKCQY